MDIECILKREGGTHMDIAGTPYHFAPLADGAHVAAVEVESHVDKLLGIPEAYKVYRGDEKPSAAPVEVPVPVAVAPVAEAPAAPVEPEQETPVVIMGSSVHPASFTIHGTTWALGDVVALAHKGSGLSAEEWNELADATRADLIDETLEDLDAKGPTEAPPVTAPSPDEVLADLRAKYKAKFNKNAHYRWDAEKIAEALADA